MTDQPYQATIKLYGDLMAEAKVRIEALNVILTRASGFIDPVAQESGYLQLRLLCEIIALSSLVAHGDIVAGERIKKEYSADKIVEHLSSLHSDFYPQPVVISEKDGHGQRHIQGGLTTDFLTQTELPKLYGRCGNALHRGNLKKLLSEHRPAVDFSELRSWGQKIQNLLAIHIVSLRGADIAFVCVLRDSGIGGKVSTSVLQRLRGAQQQVPQGVPLDAPKT